MTTSNTNAPASDAAPALDVGLSMAEKRWILLAALMLGVAAAVTATHWPALSAGAVCFDDSQYVLSNKLVRAPSWQSVQQFFVEVLQPSSVKGYYQPLTMTSLMIDFAVGGADDLRAFHRTNLILHVLNTLLVATLVYQLFGCVVPAALAGLLFGVHPISVECVAWIGERKTLLASFFALVSLNLYVPYTRTRRLDWLIAASAAYLLALLSKPTATAIPLVMLLLDYWPLSRLHRQAVLEKLPLIGFAAVSAGLTIVSQARTAGVGLHGEHVLPTVVLMVCHNIVFYLRNLVWPTDLTPFYPPPVPFDLSNGWLLAGVIGTSLMIPLLVLSVRWTKAPAVGAMIFFVTLLPALQVLGFTFTIASNKYVYLPSVGIILILAWALTRAWGPGLAPGAAWPRRAALALVVLFAALAESAQARQYLLEWKTSESLHRYMLRYAPNSGMICDLLAGDLLGQGKLSEALELQKKAVSLDPNLPVAHHNLGTTLLRTGQAAEAELHFREAFRLQPAYALPRVNLANILVSQGKLPEATAELKRAVEIDPALAEAHYSLGLLQVRQGQAQEAAWSFVNAIFQRPNFPEAHLHLGLLLADSGNLAKAVENIQQAVRLAPKYAQAHKALAQIYERVGRRTDSLHEYQEVTKLDPQDGEALLAVKNLKSHMGIKNVPTPSTQPTTQP